MQRSRPVAADRMNQSTAVRRQRAANQMAQLRVMLPTDVFQHADRHEGVVRAADIAVIIFDEFDAASQSLLPCSPAGKIDLLSRNIESPYLGSVAPRHVQGKAAPAAAGLHDRISGAEPKFSANVL